MLYLIPAPKFGVKREGSYTLSENIRVKSDFELDLLKDKMVFSDDAEIVITEDSTISQEGYRLSVTPDGISIKASTKTGAYYALVSLYKLAKPECEENVVPCCEIDDEPRFSWRGVNLDESRHFFGIDEVKRLLDNMFLEKLNVFHWHLTDDQGWRIEIKKYPLLTEIGSVRKYSHVGGWDSLKIEEKEHSGFYTQEQIKEVIEYARERGIMVVPEIDFPAHCASALAAYKHLACVEKDTEVPGYFGGIIPERKHFDFRWNRTVCCGKESSFEFIYDVLDEVCNLFDAPYIHMGGDEAPKTEWKHCEKCRAVMKREGFKDERQLQGWFENRICEYLKTKNKRLIAWNDVLRADNLNKDDKNVVIQYWTPQRDKRAEDYVNNGGAAILSNHQSFYFDMTYAEIPLNQTYEYTPDKFGINSSNIDNVLGYEGELWTEWIADREKLDLSAFPRLQALSECAWSPDSQKNYHDFKKRLDAYKPVFEKRGINYAVDAVCIPQNKGEINNILKKFRKGNPYLETELNREHKLKGDK